MELIMKTIMFGLVALSLVAGVAQTASAAEGCTVTGWTDGSWSRPIFKCPDGAN
jgi:hypothetical protein